MTACLPPGWHGGTLADVVEGITTGVSVNGEDRPVRDGEVGVLKITAVLNGTFEPHHHKAVIPADRQRVAGPVRGGTVLVSRSNTADLVGASAFVHHDVPGIFLPDKLWEVSAAAHVCPRWLAYVLAAPACRSLISAASNGTSGSMKNIAQGSFLSLPVVIPPRCEQDAIVAVLGAWDEGVSLAERLVGLARQRRQRAVDALFAATQSREYPLRDLLAEPLAYGANAAAIAYDPALPRYIRVTDLTPDGGLSDDDLKSLPTTAAAPYLLSDGDLSFARTGVGGVGQTFLHDGSFPAAFAGYLIRARTKPDALLPGFLAAYTKTSRYWEWVRVTTRTGGQPNINASEYAGLPVPVPDLDKQAKVFAVFEATRRYVALTASLATCLRDQKRALMSRLLSGDLRVTATLLQQGVGNKPAHAA